MYFEVSGKPVFASTGGKAFDNSRPVVLFLHGSGLDHGMWVLHPRFFARRDYAVLAPDLPGHTHSAGPPLASIEAYGDWLSEVVEVLDIDHISIVAHSQGCLDALEFVSREPHRIRSVSFIAGALAMPVNPALLGAAANNPREAIAMMLAWGFSSAAPRPQEGARRMPILDDAREALGRNVAEALAMDLKACNAYRNGEAAAARILLPAQVIIGGKDKMVPPKASTELAERLHDPEVHIIPGCGHFLPLEAPVICRNLLKKFIFANNPAAQRPVQDKRG